MVAIIRLVKFDIQYLPYLKEINKRIHDMSN